MMTIYEKIYFNLPVTLQNILVSIYGYKLYRERYVGKHKKYLKSLLKSQWRSKKEIDRNINRDFLNIVNYASQKVPYYQKMIKIGRISQNEINSIKDINKIPLLNKELIRENPETFLSDEYKRDKIITINTSGTTGKTLKIFVDYESRRYAYAFFSRLKRWAGINCRLPNVTFAGRTIIRPDSSSPPFWRRNIKMNNWIFSSYHLSLDNLISYIKKLQSISPHFIDSYPSSIYTLARYIVENGIKNIHPKAIITSSETLFNYQRKAIETAFQCPIFDQYGCAEQVVFISQCEHGSYHIHPEFGYVEFLRKDGSDAKPGEEARLICTGFTNRAMPLIRYDIGDTGVLAKEQNCPCGRNFPVVEKIIGRTDDILVMRDGRRVGRLDPVFKGLQTIKAAQIVQEDLDNVVLKLVPDESYDKKEAEVIVYEMKKRLGNQAKISVEILKEIPITNAGKFRAVISKVNKTQ